jgi:hypothetical protein
MKTEEEIQTAHDFLEIMLREYKNDFGRDDLINITIMRDSLCWVLNHKEGDEFEKNLSLIRDHIFGVAN